jgi:hypothetical protein
MGLAVIRLPCLFALICLAGKKEEQKRLREFVEAAYR